MRKLWIGTAVLASVMFAAVPAFAQMPAPEKFKQATTTDAGAQPLSDLAPGDDLAIACDAIEKVDDPSDVRVVLTIAAVPGDTMPGYKKVLAVGEAISGSTVRLKVPDAPDLGNHTVNLSVYVVNGAKNSNCDGGDYRIVQTAPIPISRNPG